VSGSIRLMPIDGEASEGAARDGADDSAVADPPASEEAQVEPGDTDQAGQHVDSGKEARVIRWRPHWYIVVASRYHRWHERMSISELRRRMLHDTEQWRQFDERDNNDARLPLDEEIYLGGVVLVEAFTPSTASRLKKSLEALPESYRRKSEFISALERGRSATGSGGWGSLGSVRRPGSFGFDNLDSEIPDAVEAVWPEIFYLTPSLTLLVATFTIKDDDGDLSGLMRADYTTTFSDPIIHVPGRLGWMRKRIPWLRPKGIRATGPNQRSEYKRMLACQDFISKHEKTCRDWFSMRFPGGVFFDGGPDSIPTVRILVTKENIPFQSRMRQLAPVGLSSVLDVWISDSEPDWRLGFGGQPQSGRYAITAAVCGKDAAQSNDEGAPGDFNWYLMQKFAQNQSSLIARWAVSCLLSFYTGLLARLRDRAGRRRKIGRPVRGAQDLDRFLIREGLDASTVVSDLEEFAAHPVVFHFDVPGYTEDRSAYPESFQHKHPPAQLSAALLEKIKTQGERLMRDTDAATSNITASAELRQAIANTKLQRRVLVLTVASILIALASLYVAIASPNASNNSGGGTRPNPSPSVTTSFHSLRVPCLLP
jgi:hypothetical protein